ncbi:MAG: haloalkane dehalogenase [bacterium]|nr:haloalkane dehalogenase [bacterium]
MAVDSPSGIDRTSPTRFIDAPRYGGSAVISAEERYEKKTVAALDKTMAYLEVGSGDPIVLLHGNPTSSYLWRNIIPHLEGLGRCIAPDLIGMGDSEKLQNPGPDSYRFVEHRRYLDALLEQLGVEENVTLVIHDWGSALGFDWANRHRDAVRGIAYMESIVMPLGWDQWPKAATPPFRGFRSPAGEELILEKNLFIEQVLPTSVLRDLTDEEMEVYRRPFRVAGEDRRPTLTWPRQIPLEGEPEDVVEIVRSYGAWLAECDVPKLFVNAEPGAILRGEAREFCRSWRNTTEVTVKGIHFIQEDSPDEIGQAVATWIKNRTN